MSNMGVSIRIEHTEHDDLYGNFCVYGLYVPSGVVRLILMPIRSIKAMNAYGVDAHFPIWTNWQENVPFSFATELSNHNISEPILSLRERRLTKRNMQMAEHSGKCWWRQYEEYCKREYINGTFMMIAITQCSLTCRLRR